MERLRRAAVCLLPLSLCSVMAARICMNLLPSVDVEESAHSAEISFVGGADVDVVGKL